MPPEPIRIIFPAQRDLPLIPPSTFCSWRMKDGSEISVGRSVLKMEPAMVKFHETLSDRSVYLRYFHSLSLSSRVAHDRLVRICFVDYDREIAIVAERLERRDGPAPNSWSGQAGRIPTAKNEGEVAVFSIGRVPASRPGNLTVSSRDTNRARRETVCEIEAEMLPDNLSMKKIANKLGFRLQAADPTSMRASLDL